MNPKGKHIINIIRVVIMFLIMSQKRKHIINIIRVIKVLVKMVRDRIIIMIKNRKGKANIRIKKNSQFLNNLNKRITLRK